MNDYYKTENKYENGITKQIQFDKDSPKKYNKNIYVYNLQRIGGKKHASNF